MKIRALQDRQEEHIQRLGEVRLLKEYPQKVLKITKRVTVAGVGSYTQRAELPYYRLRDIRRWRQTPEGRGAKLLGAATPGGPKEPTGCIQRREGAHLFCIPVGVATDYGGVGWRVRGFLVCDKGCAVLVQRRVLYWVVLALGAAAVFFVSYQMARHGLAQGWQMLVESVRDIPGAAADRWFALWHRL